MSTNLQVAVADDGRERCIYCRKTASRLPGDTILNYCDRCDEPVCSDCADCDYDMVDDPPRYKCTQWVCKAKCEKRSTMSQPKIEEVYRCPECDKEHSDAADAISCCAQAVPLEYKCLHCGFIWPKADEAIRCFDYERSVKRTEV